MHEKWILFLTLSNMLIIRITSIPRGIPVAKSLYHSPPAFCDVLNDRKRFLLFHFRLFSTFIFKNLIKSQSGGGDLHDLLRFTWFIARYHGYSYFICRVLKKKKKSSCFLICRFPFSRKRNNGGRRRSSSLWKLSNIHIDCVLYCA